MLRRRPGKKLLVASIGVAAVTYVACASGTGPGPEGADGGTADAEDDRYQVSGNLVAPLDAEAKDSEIKDAGKDQFVTSGNLVAPEPSE